MQWNIRMQDYYRSIFTIGNCLGCWCPLVWRMLEWQKYAFLDKLSGSASAFDERCSWGWPSTSPCFNGSWIYDVPGMGNSTPWRSIGSKIFETPKRRWLVSDPCKFVIFWYSCDATWITFCCSWTHGISQRIYACEVWCGSYFFACWNPLNAYLCPKKAVAGEQSS